MVWEPYSSFELIAGIFLGYSIGYFLWLFVHWYYDERPKTRTFKVHKDDGELSLELNTTRTLRLLDASGKNPPWPGKVLVRDLSWKRKADGSIEVTVDFVTYKDPEVLVEKPKVHKPTWTINWDELDKQWEENMKIINEDNKKLDEYIAQASKKLSDHIEKQILSPPAKTSGEPEKEKPIPCWEILTPKGQRIHIQQAECADDALQIYANKCLRTSSDELRNLRYRVVEHKPTSPPPPPKSLWPSWLDEAMADYFPQQKKGN